MRDADPELRRVQSTEEGYDSYDDGVDLSKRPAKAKKQQVPVMPEDEVDEMDVDMEGSDEDEQEKSNNLFSDDEERDKHGLSTFEKKQQEMSGIISSLEAEAIAEKPWVLTGEANAKKRPKNSLLEQDLEVDYARRPAPVITEETTFSLEDLIKSRIREALFDDVIRKKAPSHRDFDPNRRLELNDEKSGKSLAQVYEDDFLAQKAGTEHKSENTAALEKQHEEIDDLFTDLCKDLDSLSHWQFAPRPVRADIEILPAASVPALSKEEVIPTAENLAASLLAPKEAFDGKAEKSQHELLKTDKKRLREKKKREVRAKKTERAQFEKEREEKGQLTEKEQKAKAVKTLLKDQNVTVLSNLSKKGDKKAPKEAPKNLKL